MTVLESEPNHGDIASELDTDGFVCLKNAVNADWLAETQRYVHGLVDKKGARYFALNWPSREQGSPVQKITSDPNVRSLLEELVELGCPRAEREDEIYNVLRVVTGDNSGDSKSLRYHYDNTVITALVPILVPKGSPRHAGELLAFPNTRPYRRIDLTNIAEKAVVQSDWYRQRFTNKLPDGDMSEIRILEPGNIYLFWGYRTYHGNFPAAPNAVRATLLLHHGNPHPNSFALNWLKKRNVRREQRNLAASRSS